MCIDIYLFNCLKSEEHVGPPWTSLYTFLLGKNFRCFWWQSKQAVLLWFQCKFMWLKSIYQKKEASWTLSSGEIEIWGYKNENSGSLWSKYCSWSIEQKANVESDLSRCMLSIFRMQCQFDVKCSKIIELKSRTGMLL